MARDPFIREKFTKERSAARAFAEDYFERYPKDRYQTEVESWRHLQSANIEFVMKRLRGAGVNLPQPVRRKTTVCSGMFRCSYPLWGTH
jgi:hypothetical protein